MRRELSRLQSLAETYLAKFGLIQITLPMIQGKEKINATKNGEKTNLYELCYISIVTQKCYLVSGYLRYVMLVLNKLALLVIVSVSYSVVTKPSVGLWRTSNYATKFRH